MHQINRQWYVHDCLDKKIVILPHLLDLEKCVTPNGHFFVLAVPFYYIAIPQYYYYYYYITKHTTTYKASNTVSQLHNSSTRKGIKS
jgi:hypothetical protein